MKAPGKLDFTPEQIDNLIARVENKSLATEDYPILADLLRAIIWLNFSLQEKQLSIKRLRLIFGIRTESAKKLLKLVGQGEDLSSQEEKDEESDSQKEKENNQESSSKKKNHGHKASTEYSEAKIIKVFHEYLKRGSVCPDCKKGRLFNLKPGSVLRIVGQPWLQVEVYHPERLRCSLCGKIFTATLPKDVGLERVDQTAKAIVSLLKYRGGVPFYRQEQIQDILGAPISASEIWEMTEDVADTLLPVYSELCHQAANAELLYNDDTTAKILSIINKRKESEESRSGIFTTGIIAKLTDTIKIGLFFTGRKHAGENLDSLLNQRLETLSPPIQECDASSRNIPKNHKTEVANCLAHARRKFYELIDFWPKIVSKVIGYFSDVFNNEHTAPPDPENRLEWHQEKSAPKMQEMKNYCNDLIDKKMVEPNSSMGKAIAYLNNHWDTLTTFLRVPGVPLTNNENERLLKKSVLNRKNAYFFKNETGAKIADILMSTIETCVLNNINPYEYLVTIQKYQKNARANPALWVPWLYELQLKKLNSS